MHPEVAEVIAERESRSRHKVYTWTRKDQADQDAWEYHDNNRHSMPYAICTVCEYLAVRSK